METPFYFSCNCSLVEESYNTSNKSYNYSYQDKDGKSIYMISMKNTNIGNKGFLDSIKYSGAFNYKNVNFKGVNAIVAEIYQGDNMAFILVFSNKNGYSIILASPDKNRTAKCLLNLVKPLIINKYKTDHIKKGDF